MKPKHLSFPNHHKWCMFEKYEFQPNCIKSQIIANNFDRLITRCVGTKFSVGTELKFECWYLCFFPYFFFLSIFCHSENTERSKQQFFHICNSNDECSCCCIPVFFFFLLLLLALVQLSSFHLTHFHLHLLR